VENIYDLAEWRAQRRPEPLPPELLDEIDAAGRVYDALLAQGHELRFELPEHGRERVRVELRTVGGAFVRRVPLAEAVDPTGRDGAPAA